MSESRTGIDYLRNVRNRKDRRYRPNGLDVKCDSIVDIQARTRQIMRLKLAGLTNTEVAQTVGCSTNTVSTHLNSPAVQEEFAKLQEAADIHVVEGQRKLATAVEKATEVLINGVSKPSMDPKLQVKCATEILDRTGISRVTKTESRHTHAHLGADDLREILARGLEARREMGSVIDVEAQGA